MRRFRLKRIAFFSDKIEKDTSFRRKDMEDPSFTGVEPVHERLGRQENTIPDTTCSNTSYRVSKHSFPVYKPSSRNILPVSSL